MKRSQVQIEICKLLEEQSLQGTAYMYKAQQVLELIEKLGMSPPEAEFLFERHLDKDLTVKFYKKDTKWENED